MTREEKITAIYKEMANKELSLWCKLKFVVGSKKSVYAEDCFSKFLEDWIVESSESYEDEIQIFYNYTEGTYIYFCTNCEESVLVYSNDFEIIWHPVMIGDVISYLRKPFDKFIEWHPVGENWLVDSYSKNINNLLVKWFDTSLPIDEQDDECVDFIYSLIKK